ncbi:HAD family hydrolase [Anabaenopsis arnoldii]|uniref:HAD family phosphatase n=1 Tax=Anabaenopsis arnoldii TaxID=2152938 RepID=A0ABT5AUH7_9CYAN|nr:HAD family phosphatase [Anabaenopsis arnoldii]MDB9540978.1 HAD family phosphatase [Anabaenopsis arnoldii]MDH6093416.1 HAD family phosphatase [Anabaenopsis arnoldii]
MLSSYRGAIFDMDGLIFDTESIARWAWKQALKEHGYIMSDNLYRSLVGRDLSWREKLLKKVYGESLPFDSVTTQRIAIGDERELREGLPMKPGVLDLLQRLNDLGMMIGLATGTGRTRAIRRLTNAGIKQYFTIIVTSEDVAEGKPAPDIFLEASHRMNIAPAECIVFEDSCVGVEAAFEAGMCAIMVPDIEEPSPEISNLAYGVFKSLEEVGELLPPRVKELKVAENLKRPNMN